MELIFQIIVLTAGLVKVVLSHGMMLEPVNRGSRWRYDPSAPIDYNDNEGFCGGFFIQWTINKGKCGLCGDSYNLKTPRPHEYGGEYGNGTIVKTFKINSQIPVSVLLTANHIGYFLFDICNMDSKLESETCFDQYHLNLVTGETRYDVKTINIGWYNTTLALPKDLACNHCVLRWTYITGNSWGICPNGTQAMGCGSQENFRSCADIAILPAINLDIDDIPEDIQMDNYVEQ